MDEQRLIDANLFELIALDGVSDEFAEGARYILEMIDAAQTVDAVPVVPGHWEDEYGGRYVNPRYRCSVCKEKALFRRERDLLGKWHSIQALTRVCPHCGAKMDGERSEKDV